jgi:hypothetical protein
VPDGFQDKIIKEVADISGGIAETTLVSGEYVKK